MSEPDLTNREDPKLQADPALRFSEGRATLGLKLFVGIAAILIVLGTLYEISYQPQSKPFVAVSGTVLPQTTGQER